MKLDAGVHACNSGTWEAKMEASQVQVLPGQLSEPYLKKDIKSW